jgi:hypothetical protein
MPRLLLFRAVAGVGWYVLLPTFVGLDILISYFLIGLQFRDQDARDCDYGKPGPPDQYVKVLTVVKHWNLLFQLIHPFLVWTSGSMCVAVCSSVCLYPTQSPLA